MTNERAGPANGPTGGPYPPLVIGSMLRPRGNSGVQTHVQQVLEYLADGATPADVTLLTPFSWGGLLQWPVFGLRLALAMVSASAGVRWYRYWHEVFLRRALRKRLARLGDCVIYAQDPPSARAALAVRRDPGQQVVLAVHFRVSQADEWADKGAIRRGGRAFQSIRQLERTVIPRVDRIVYVSAWAQQALTGWLPEAAAVPSAMIGNFVASRLASPGREPLGDLVTVGSLEPVKNHRFLLQVLASAKHAGYPLTLDIFGDGPLRDELHQQAAALGLAGQVRLRGFQRNLRDFLPGYRAYVHASVSESSSLAIMEAMDAGLPIVAADIGPLGELFDDGVEGRFWPISDPAQAAAVLIELLQDETGRRRLGQAARERFEQDYDADVVGPRLRSFLLEGGAQPVSAG